MTRNLTNAAGLGHFLLVLGRNGSSDGWRHAVERMSPGINLGKMPPAVSTIGTHGLVAAWGGITVDHGERSSVVGVFQRARYDRTGGDAAAVRRVFENAGASGTVDPAPLLGGNFCAVAVDRLEPRALALTAPFRQLPLYRVSNHGVTAFATDARLLTAAGIVSRDIDVESLYHYLNFSCIPAPFSIFRRVRKIPPGTQLRATPETTIEEPYWRTRFTGDIDGPEGTLETELRERIYAAVRSHRPPDNVRWGAFLSGGTDSSSITGILATEEGREPVRTFSIGFGEEGYDELAFARIAAEHFGARAHFRTVNEQDTLKAIPTLLEAYDEPYGNASAIPTYYCARAAADEGVNVMIAGDGGDESFGGNERYARDAIYRAYAKVPRSLRRAIARGFGRPSRAGSLLMNRLRNFASRGALDNPARFYCEESFASECFDELLSPGMRSALQRDASLELVQRHYDDAGETEELHRLMYIDQMMAIADNDLTKVQRASQAAGVTVNYPYLDPDLVTYAARLRARWKVRGLKKRYLFKRALKDLLPAEILAKPKQGFGLPIALWARQPGEFRALMQDTLRSQRAAERGWFSQAYVESLLDSHDRGGWDLSPELWRLLMLELWQREYVDGQ